MLRGNLNVHYNQANPLPELDEKGKDGTRLAGLRCSERDGLGLTGLEKRVWQETSKGACGTSTSNRRSAFAPIQPIHSVLALDYLRFLVLVQGYDIPAMGWDSESDHDFPLRTTPTTTLTGSHRAHT